MTKKLDFTRFDFHASRFLHSEAVQKMTAEETGQYILLLCYAWLSGKNASLPNDPELLAKYARSPQVSTLVLAQWKLGEDGRYRNKTLSEEWEAAVGRSNAGMRGANKRWSKETNAPVDGVPMPQHKVPIAHTNQTNPTQAVPTHTNPTNSSGPMLDVSGSSGENIKYQTPADIISLASELDVPATDIERVFLYHWKYNCKQNPFWQQKAPVPTVALFRKCWSTMLLQVPSGWQVPPPPAPQKVYNPECPNCGGEGGRNVMQEDMPGKPLMWIDCDCWREHSASRGA